MVCGVGRCSGPPSSSQRCSSGSSPAARTRSRRAPGIPSPSTRCRCRRRRTRATSSATPRAPSSSARRCSGTCRPAATAARRARRCHFNAGADSRSRNQVNPQRGRVHLQGPERHARGRRLPAAPLVRRHEPRLGRHVGHEQRRGLAGRRRASPFAGVTPGDPQDVRTFGPDPIFSIGGTSVRQTTTRNSPSVINAVFNFRNFWDGRAQNDFNGVSPFGARDTAARGRARQRRPAAVDQVAVSLSNSSLASQAVAPPGNAVEMSADGRTLSDVGQQAAVAQAAGRAGVSAERQRPRRRRRPVGPRPGDVATRDSIRAGVHARLVELGRDPGRRRTAAGSRSWSSTSRSSGASRSRPTRRRSSPTRRRPTGSSRATTSALSASAQAGLDVFRGPGRCSTCHLGAGLSDATAANVAATGLTSTDAGLAVDTGFLNIGVRPTASDPGLGGLDPFGNPLSEARRAGATNDKVSGSFKVPQLRNVALTAPVLPQRRPDDAAPGRRLLQPRRRLRQRRAERRARHPQPDRDAEERPRRLPAVADRPARRGRSRRRSTTRSCSCPRASRPARRRGASRTRQGSGSTASCRCRRPARAAARRCRRSRPSPAPCRRRRRCPAAPRRSTAAAAPPASAPAPPSRRPRPREVRGTKARRRDPLRRPPPHRPHAHRRQADAPAGALRPRPRHARGRRTGGGWSCAGRCRRRRSRHKAGTKVRLDAAARSAPRRAPVSRRRLSARAGPSARRPRRPAATGRAPSRGRRGG